MKKNITFIILVNVILSLIMLFFISWETGNKVLGSGNKDILFKNSAVHIDTKNSIDRYTGVLFDGNHYYICVHYDQKDTPSKYTLIKLNPDLTFNYAKYHRDPKYDINLELSNLCFNPNNSNELFFGGTYALYGIIGKIN